MRPFPDTDRARWQVSLDGGSEPRWAGTGRELFYRTPRGEIVSRRVDAIGETFRLENPEVLFDASGYRADPLHYGYDVTPDGQRFVMIASNRSASRLVVVVNWLEELRERVGRR